MKAKTIRSSFYAFAVAVLLMLGACGAQGSPAEQAVSESDGSEITTAVTTTTTAAATTTILSTTTTATTTVAYFPQLEDLHVGDRFFFGSYEQDNDLSNGAEPIEWRVLEVRNDRSALVISEYTLDCVPYNEERISVTWDACTLRSWLNNEFFNSAFSPDEQQRILETTLSDPDNPFYGTNGGTDTKDKVFCLSIDEAEKYFSDIYDRKCKPTDYARAQRTSYEMRECQWWLRSPGSFRSSATFVNGSKGKIYDHGSYVDYGNIGVRPVVVVRLSD